MALVGLLGSGSAQAGVEFGPAPKDEDGRFLNRAGPIPQAGARITWPFFLRRAAGTFRSRPGAPTRRENSGQFLRENAGHSSPTVTWVGHATLVVQMAHATFLTDPTWSSTASPVRFAGPRRFVEPGIDLEALPRIDFVLISHNHYDHLDLPSLRAIARRNPEARFFVPLGNARLLRGAGIERITELDWGDTAAFGPLRIHCLPTQHWSRRGIRDMRRALWASFAVVGPDRRFYFAGDAGFSRVFAEVGMELGPFDLAALPIGAYEPVEMMRPWHLDPEEAVRAGTQLRARRLLGIHFGTFDLSDEPLDEPPRRFRAAGTEAGIDPGALWLLEVGETRAF